MSLKTKTINRLMASRDDREAYLRAKLNHLLPSQIKALRLRREWTQLRLGELADMKQARISAVEKSGEVAFTLDTLIRLASAFKVGLQVKFVPLSQMLEWERRYSQDKFDADPIESDMGLHAEPEETTQFAGLEDNSGFNEMAWSEDFIAEQDLDSSPISVGAMAS